MKDTLRYILLLCAATLLSHSIGGLWGAFAGIGFYVLMESATRSKPKEFKQAIEVPGMVTFRPTKEMGFNINGKEFLIHPNDAITVEVPDECSSIGIIYAQEKTAQVDDSILDAKVIADE